MFLIGWFLIRPVNAGLGWFFRAFNRFFDWMTGTYGNAVGKVLRLSVVVLVIYGGLLGLTYWQFSRTPSGFIPQQDKGYLLLNVQLPDAASVTRTKEVVDKIEKIALKTPGVRHTVAIAGQSILLNANAPNFGAMYVMLDDFHDRLGPGLSGPEIAATLQRKLQDRIGDGLVNVYARPESPPLEVSGAWSSQTPKQLRNDCHAESPLATRPSTHPRA